jgi:hypothetical protein
MAATIVPTFSKIRGPTGGQDAVLVTWVGLVGLNDVGTSFVRPDLVDRCVAVTGNFAGGTVVFEGSNDNSNYFTLTNPVGGNVQFTAAGLMQITEAAAYVRPRISSAVNTATIVMTARRTLR